MITVNLSIDCVLGTPSIKKPTMFSEIRRTQLKYLQVLWPSVQKFQGQYFLLFGDCLGIIDDFSRSYLLY